MLTMTRASALEAGKGDVVARKRETATRASTPSPNSVAVTLDAAGGRARGRRLGRAFAARSGDARRRARCRSPRSRSGTCTTSWWRRRGGTCASTARAARAAVALDNARVRPFAHLRLAAGGVGDVRRQVPARRTLATTYLSNPSVDGWNVVFGATGLARAWALRDLSDLQTRRCPRSTTCRSRSAAAGRVPERLVQVPAPCTRTSPALLRRRALAPRRTQGARAPRLRLHDPGRGEGVWRVGRAQQGGRRAVRRDAPLEVDLLTSVNTSLSRATSR